jgi:hypothetical protein
MVNLLHLTHTNLAANPKNGIFQIRKWVSVKCWDVNKLHLLQRINCKGEQVPAAINL